MSNDTIKRSDAIKAIDECFALLARLRVTARKALEAVPSADRPQGEWIWHEDEDICNCSECEFEIDATGCIEPMEYVGVFRYCPNCGARMFAKDINVPNKEGADDE